MPDPGDRLSMGGTLPPVFFRHLPTRIHAQATLLYIDSSLAIVNKGAGLLSVPVPDSNQVSALTVLEKFLQGKGATELDQQKGVHRKRLIPLPVHRLDQYTSGIICFRDESEGPGVVGASGARSYLSARIYGDW